MYTEQAFQEAESQGYKCVNRIIKASTNPGHPEAPAIEIDRDYFYTLGDPAFWMALGAARGWRHPNQYPKWKKEEGTALILFYPDDSWAAWQHRYLDHAIEDGYNDHQQFFKQFYVKEEPVV